MLGMHNPWRHLKEIGEEQQSQQTHGPLFVQVVLFICLYFVLETGHVLNTNPRLAHIKLLILPPLLLLVYLRM
jgi:hypothetical protein